MICIGWLTLYVNCPSNIIFGKENIIADRLSRFRDIYRNNQIDQQFEYISTLTMVNIINDIFMKMLDFKKCPRNYDDPLRVHL